MRDGVFAIIREWVAAGRLPGAYRMRPYGVGGGVLDAPRAEQSPAPTVRYSLYIVKQLLCPNRQAVLFIQMETVKKLRVIVGDGAAAPLVIQ